MGGVSISVVVPCHNYARFLPDALESIYAQTVQPLEVIVIDDGSSDGSADIAESYHADVRVIRQEKQGISGARNAGVGAARGDLIAFLDADDLWLDDSLATRLAVFRDDPSTDCVFGEMEQFICPNADSEVRARLFCPPGSVAARFPGTMLVRRSVFDRVGLFDGKLRVGEMIDWMSRLNSESIVIKTVETCVLRRRIHGANTVLSLPDNRSDYLRALQAAIQRRKAIQ